MFIETLSTRKQAMDYLEGYVQEKKEEINSKHTSFSPENRSQKAEI